METKYVEVDGQKYVDDGTGGAKVDETGNPIPFVEEKHVPFERFKEVNDLKNAHEKRVAELQAELERRGGLSPEKQKELEAEKYLSNLVETTLEKRERQKAQQEEEKLRQFNSNVDRALEENPDVKRADFLKFYEKEGSDFSSVGSAIKQFKRIEGTSKEALEKGKKEATRKPNLPSHEGGGGGKAPETDKGKSIGQIAEDIISAL